MMERTKPWNSRLFLAAKALILAACLCLGLHTPALARQLDYSVLANYTQLVYDYSNGLMTSSINDVLQTSDGYIWLAGYTGLIRYDGNEFVTMGVSSDSEETIPNVMKLFEDSKGRLWIGTNDSSVLLYQDQTFTPIAGDQLLAVTGFAEKKDGSILFSAKEGLFTILADGSCEDVDQTHAIDHMLLDAQEQLWLIDLYGKLIAPEPAGGLIEGNRRYSTVFEDSKGDIWLGTDSGDILWLKKSGESYEKGPTVSTDLTVINSFCEDLAGNVWVVSDSGMGMLDADRNFRFADGGKITNSLAAISADFEGSLWIASTRGGLLQMIPSVIRDYSFAGNLGSHVTNSAIEYAGDTYIATDEGLFIMDARDRLIENELTGLLSGIRVRCLTEDSKGNLWIAAYSRYGAIRYSKDGQITIFNTETGLISDRARVVVECKSGDIAVGTSDGLSILRQDEVVRSYGVAQGLSNGVVLSLAEDASGRLYVGTDGGGIFSVENDQVAPVDVGAMKSKVILRLLCDEETGALWISSGAALYYYDGALTELPHIWKAVNAVFDMIPTPDGRICLLATNGIVCGNRETLIEGNSDMVVILNRGGMPFHITANSFNRINAEGELFLCGAEEVGRFNVKYLMNNSSPARLIIVGITVDHTRELVRPEITLDRDAKRLTIDVASPHFGFEENIMFEYALEKFDDEPQRISANEQRSITYTNLAGGTYDFKIRVQNGRGEYSDEQHIVIKKDHQWYELPAVWAAIGVLLILMVLILIKVVMAVRIRKILQKQAEYKRITEQAISTISNAIDAKDAYTEGHSERVAAYSVEIGRRMGMSEDELEHLNYIALLHDIGKIGISDTILNKPSRLTDDEFVVMKSHTSIGSDILKDFVAVTDIGAGALEHHEKYNGTGYPKGLKGEQISLIARIICVCDTFDAMATTRAYREAQGNDYIISELEKFSGVQFDPEIAKIMIEMVKEGRTQQ